MDMSYIRSLYDEFNRILTNIHPKHLDQSQCDLLCVLEFVYVLDDRRRTKSVYDLIVAC